MAAPPRVKICGLTRNEDALHAVASGADFVGVVLSPGFGRSVAAPDAPDVVQGVSAQRVAVLVDESPAQAARLADAIDASVVQLHGSEDRATVQALRELGDWTIWKAVRARSLDELGRTVELLGDVVDGILVEGWREGVIGGGGVRVSLDGDAVRGAVPGHLTLVLAGGLDPATVQASVARFRPDVVDVSSGVERATGIKSAEKVTAFVREARRTPPKP